MRSSSSVLLGTCFAIAAALAACSSDSNTGSTAGDGGSSSSSSSSSGSTSSSGGSSSGGSSSGSSGGDAGTVSDCTTFVDETAAGSARVIKWDFNVFSTPERCMKIKVGQAVTWTSDGASTPADFATHPIVPNGGDTPNPISSIDESTGKVTFSAKGTYGFMCNVHGSMTGAIEVVE